MTDSTLNKFVAAGTAADRVAFTPSPPTPASGAAQGYFWHETDTGDTYSWKAGTGWIKVNSIGTGPSTSLSQISSSLSGAISSTTSLSSAVSTVDSNQSTSLSQVSSSLSGAISSTSSLSTAVSTVDSNQSTSISANLSKINSLSTAVGGGGGAWTELDYYDATASGATAGRAVSTSGYNEVLVIFDAVTLTGSGHRVVQVSDDGGSTYYASANQYTFVDGSGVPTTTDDAFYGHTTASTAARWCVIQLLNLKNTRGFVQGLTPNRSFNTEIFTAGVAGTPINQIIARGRTGVGAFTNMTGGKILILAR